MSEPSERGHLRPVGPRERPAGHRTRAELDRGLKLPPAPPAEPRWASVFPSVRGDRGQQQRAGRLRAWAREEWRRVVAELDRVGRLAGCDHGVLLRHVTAYALEQELVADVAARGAWQHGERGAMKNPSVTALNQQRQVLAQTTRELGLSPAARDRMRPADGGEGDGAEALD